jgi:hypothetical protein
VLTRHRDQIAAELGQLSGVIQALAVPVDNLPAHDEDTHTEAEDTH